ncbi:MAG: sulfite exporter TauE/SafE family protein [Magnetococcales bacterium]|nr:sulfite exporter TauE/SafE family protein [Magnetococcales bacterium]
MLLVWVGCILTGLAAGILAGLFGVGGGIVIVPALLFLFYMDGMMPAFSMQLAVGTSLATIIVTNLLATWNHHRRGSVAWQEVMHFTPGVILGAWLGAMLAVKVSGASLKLFFGLFEIAVGLMMMFATDRFTRRERKGTKDSGVHALFGLGIGGVSSLLGIGGGTMSVPVLSWVVGLPIRLAVGSASAIGVALSLAGAAGFIQAGWGHDALPPGSFGYVLPQAFFGIVIGTLITTPIGVKLAHTIQPQRLKQAFGVMLLAVGVKMVLV